MKKKTRISGTRAETSCPRKRSGRRKAGLRKSKGGKKLPLTRCECAAGVVWRDESRCPSREALTGQGAPELGGLRSPRLPCLSKARTRRSTGSEAARSGDSREAGTRRNRPWLEIPSLGARWGGGGDGTKAEVCWAFSAGAAASYMASGLASRRGMLGSGGHRAGFRGGRRPWCVAVGGTCFLPPSGLAGRRDAARGHGGGGRGHGGAGGWGGLRRREGVDRGSRRGGAWGAPWGEPSGRRGVAEALWSMPAPSPGLAGKGAA